MRRTLGHEDATRKEKPDFGQRPTNPLRYPAPVTTSLGSRLHEATDPDATLDVFLDYVAGLGLELYPAQEQAVLELLAGSNVILSTPTGSGKTLVATALQLATAAKGIRSCFGFPIKALASEKFFALCKEFGPERVGMLTGDATINPEAPILCCTTEVLASMGLSEGKRADIGAVILDEFHYYSDKDRGSAWQIPLLTLPQAQFLLMSATMGDTLFFERELEKRTKRKTVTVSSRERPVPLDFTYSENALHETLQTLTRENKAPVYIVSFSQRAAIEEAQNLMSHDFATKEEKKAIAETIREIGTRFDTPFGKTFERILRHGIGIHHAGLLPKYRRLVERLAQTGKLKIVSGTDTLGVGVNIPLRSVVLTKLCRFDGEKTVLLSAREFHQMAGRAGRRGFDVQGSVVVQAPEHAIENLKLQAKIEADPSKKKKIVMRKPPDRGYVHWDRRTFDRLVTAPPEALTSRFDVTHAMILDVLRRPKGGCMAIGRLIRDCHETPHQKRVLGRRARELYQALLSAGVVKVEQTEQGRCARVQDDDGGDFSLLSALSLYLVQTLGMIDPLSANVAEDTLSLVEAVVETPEILLLRQQDKLRTDKLNELKAQGVPFEERQEHLEKVLPPEPPNVEFLRESFRAFADVHPWVVGTKLRPKVIAREMFELRMTFNEYVKEYGLERMEGVLLRYLSETYKLLTTGVPERYKTEEIWGILDYLSAIVRQVDTSLLDEWQRMRFGAEAPKAASIEPITGEEDITRDKRAFAILVQSQVIQLLRLLARGNFVDAAALIATRADGARVLPAMLEEGMRAFEADNGRVETGAEARRRHHLVTEDLGEVWTFALTLLNQEGPTEWVLRGSVDLQKSRESGEPSLVFVSLGPE